jgi:hypothetical protein
MSTVAEPLTGSILYRQQRAQLDLLEEAVQELAKHQELNEESQSVLEQVVRILLHESGTVRDLWEWCQERELAGRLRNRSVGAQSLRDLLSAWLDLLTTIHNSALKCEAAGYPIRGAEDLPNAADEMAAIGREVNRAWPIEELPPPPASTGLSYQELRRLADLPTPVREWPEEDFDRS